MWTGNGMRIRCNDEVQYLTINLSFQIHRRQNGKSGNFNVLISVSSTEILLFSLIVRFWNVAFGKRFCGLDAKNDFQHDLKEELLIRM